ncbi:MAG: peptidoglycan-binding protein [Clostridia bacterium]|nr:peptidoglycan-binding protein [Clostridia bacterium]
MERRIIGLLLALVLLLIPMSNAALAEATPGEAEQNVKATVAASNEGTITVTVSMATDKQTEVKLYKGDTLIKKEMASKDGDSFSFSNLDDGDYQVRLFDYASEKQLRTYNVKIDKTKTAKLIKGTVSVDGSKLTATVTDASSLEILVEVYLNGSVVKSGKITGPGSLSFDGLSPASYSVRFSYTAADTGVPPEVVDATIEAESVKSSVDIKITSVKAGEETLSVYGVAAPGSPLLISLTPGGYDRDVTPDANGTFSTTISCAANTYTIVTAQYQGNPGSKVTLDGSWVVTASSEKPVLTVDPIYDTDKTVLAKTKAGTPVSLETYDYTEYLTADANGQLKFSLPHVYISGTNVIFTVSYGEGYKSSYQVSKMVETSPTYKELSYGSTGTEVQALTTRLAALNYPVSITSVYDNAVVNAVRLFQSRNYLPETGVADNATQRAAYSSSAIAYDSYTYPTLVRGDRGTLVRNLQSRLQKLGYYTIKVDGIFGSGTQRAVRNFQSRNGLSVTGIADNTTQKVLYSSSAISSGGYSPVYYTTLSRSSRYNSAVVSLQSRLNALGYAAGTVDGYFGSRTYRAVRNFQSRNGLSVTGVADVTTQEILYSSAAVPAGSSYSYTTVTSTGYRLLYWGCKGDAVIRLQQALRNKGYTQIKSIDGIYGQQTYDAVCAFQKANGLTVDGIAGKKTQNLLYGTSY